MLALQEPADDDAAGNREVGLPEYCRGHRWSENYIHKRFVSAQAIKQNQTDKSQNNTALTKDPWATKEVATELKQLLIDQGQGFAKHQNLHTAAKCLLDYKKSELAAMLGDGLSGFMDHVNDIVTSAFKGATEDRSSKDIVYLTTNSAIDPDPCQVANCSLLWHFDYCYSLLAGLLVLWASNNDCHRASSQRYCGRNLPTFMGLCCTCKPCNAKITACFRHIAESI